jgi:hypothetical protein
MQNAKLLPEISYHVSLFCYLNLYIFAISLFLYCSSEKMLNCYKEFQCNYIWDTVLKIKRTLLVYDIQYVSRIYELLKWAEYSGLCSKRKGCRFCKRPWPSERLHWNFRIQTLLKKCTAQGHHTIGTDIEKRNLFLIFLKKALSCIATTFPSWCTGLDSQNTTLVHRGCSLIRLREV